jgi:hypothetical protein
MKTTSIKQPQSSCPFKSANQKIYGLGYALLVFVYEKTDNDKTRNELAKHILKNRPKIGYLTISNALQWRLQYSRIIEKAEKAEGVVKIK